MGGGGCERHGEEESKTNKSNSVRDREMLREVERDRGVRGAWKSQDNKSNGVRDRQMLREVERDRGVHGTRKRKTTRRRGNAEVRR